MKITPIKTEIVHAFSNDITEILVKNIKSIAENSVVAITSKIISLCEGNVVKIGSISKDDIIKSEAKLFLPKSDNQYGVYLTIKNNTLIPNSGIDESNTGGYYVLWPKDTYASAKLCQMFLKNHFKVENVGVIITDSVPTPLKWGVTGICIAHSGFSSINDKVEKRDVFGRKIEMTKVNVADGLAAAAVLCMGEVDEKTPIAILEDLPFVNFNQNSPTQEELDAEKIDIDDDLYGQLLKAVSWQNYQK